MITYEYQILRYIPDQVSGEFLNVGIVMYDPTEMKVLYEFIDSKKRISAAFHGIESTHILRRLKLLGEKLEDVKNRQSSKLSFSDRTGLSSYSEKILTRDDSALQFSDVRKGIDIGIESAFRDLEHRLLYKWEAKKGDKYRSDEDVWRDRYKNFFEKAGITKSMVSRIVDTNTDTIHFDQAFKNGIWNFFQPINLNLKNDESIRNKVYKWRGIISALQTLDEKMKIIFLSEMPEKNNGIKEFIQDHLITKKKSELFSELVTPEDIDDLLLRYMEN